jgi:hypothetical protein
MVQNSKIIARRTDGYGFLTGTLVGVVRRHGHRVYLVKAALTGVVRELSAAQYRVSLPNAR